MKVCHIVTSEYGGAARYAMRLSTALNILGVDSDLAVVERSECSDAYLIERRQNFFVRLWNRGMQSIFNRLSVGVYQPFSCRGRLVPEVDLSSYDVIHLHSINGWAGFHNLKKMLPQNAKVFWTMHDVWALTGGFVVHNDYVAFLQKRKTSSILYPLLAWHSSWELKKKSAFIDSFSIIPVANSEWMRSQVIESKPFSSVAKEDVGMVYPIIADVFFARGDSILERKKKSGVKKIALSARSLTDSYKGIPHFVEALAKCCDGISHPDFEIWFIGDGVIEVTPSLNVQFLGKIKSEQAMAEILKEVDVFVSSSLMETFGMAVAEAQAAGCMVTAFDVGGIRDAIAPQQRKYLVPLENYDFLAKKTLELLATPPDEQVLNGSIEWVESRCASVPVAQSQLSLYYGSNETKLKY